jgi:hypothetical protein
MFIQLVLGPAVASLSQTLGQWGIPGWREVEAGVVGHGHQP